VGDREAAELLSLLGEAALRLEHERRSQPIPTRPVGSGDVRAAGRGESPATEPPALIRSPTASSRFQNEPAVRLLDELATRLVAARRQPGPLRPLLPAAAARDRSLAASGEIGNDLLASSALADADVGVSGAGREVEPTDRSATEPGLAGARAGAFAQIARAAADDTSAATVAPGRAAGAADTAIRPLLLEEVAEAFGVDTGRLAALVNEALQEQARRHGVDLS
jgi:hypothetical protein